MKYNVLVFLLILLFAGCGRIVDWAKSNFNQGKEIGTFEKIPREYVRSVTVYNQVETLGMFDALWLSDPVRIAFADAHAQRFGKTEEQKNAFLRRQLEENNHFISFYLLTKYENKLTDAQAEWTVMMKIDDNIFLPIELKVVDLSEEYKMFFGPYYSRFKTAYLVKFDAKDVDGNSLINDHTKMIALLFRRIDKEAMLEWHFDSQFQLIPDREVKKERNREERRKAKEERSAKNKRKPE